MSAIGPFQTLRLVGRQSANYLAERAGTLGSGGQTVLLTRFFSDRPKAPIDAVVAELRAFCDRTALGVLANYIEAETHSPDLILTAEQKQYFTDLWANMVFEIGVRFRKGKSQRLCQEALSAEVRDDPSKAEIQSTIWRMVTKSTDSRQNVQDMLDEAFGSGAFDHTKRPRGMPGVDLAMCVRAADHLASRTRF